MGRFSFGAALLVVLAAGCTRDGAPDPAGDGSARAAQNGLATSRAGSLSSSGDWPQWLGPQRDGVSTETGWSAQWPSSGLKTLWRTNVGTGFSSISVAAGRAYTMGRRGSQDVVYSFDAATGDKKWEYAYDCKLVDNLHEGGPGATPTVAGDRVYTFSREGHLFCFDAGSGRVQWSQQLADELGVEMPAWGFTSSPLVLQDLVILDAGRTVALNKTTGAPVWQTSNYRAGYGAPAAFQHRGQPLVTVLNNDRLIVVRADDGSEVAQFDWQTEHATSATTPVVAGDTIFISTGYRRGCCLLRFDGRRLTPLYENRNLSNHFNNSILFDGYLYGFDGNSHNSRNVTLVCLNHKTGAVAWRQRGFGCGSLLIADGKLVILSEDGQLVSAEATPKEYREIARAKVLSGRCWTMPAVAGGRVYCRNAAGDLVCLELPAE